MVEEKEKRKMKTAKEEANASAETQQVRETQTQPAPAVCNDVRCALHGQLETRGRVFEGIVISDKMQKTITVEWPRLHYIPKFERYEKRRSRVKAHNPPCISAKAGDTVRIAECRPLAKTVKFVVIEKLVGKI